MNKQLSQNNSEDVSMLNPNFDTENVPLPEPRSELLESDHCHNLQESKAKNRNKTVWLKLIAVFILCILFKITEITRVRTENFRVFFLLKMHYLFF